MTRWRATSVLCSSSQIKPDNADAFNNRGIVLRDLKRYTQAQASYERALGIKSEFARHIEQAYRHIYERYQADLPPDHFSVAP